MSEVAHFVPCTGRGRLGAYQALGSLGKRLEQCSGPGIFLNGLVVYAPGGALLSDIALPRDIAAEVVAFAAQHKVSLVGFSGDRSLSVQRCEWTSMLVAAHDPEPELVGSLVEERNNKMVLLGGAEKMAELRPLLQRRLGDGASLVCSGPTWMLEVLPYGASKGGGVRTLLDALGQFSPVDVLAIGDAENDIGMLQLAGTSVAMGNAPSEVRAVAHHVSAANDADGAALAIERHVLEPKGIFAGAAYSAYCGDVFAERKR